MRSLVCAGAVSYTHLDVYKRQVLHYDKQVKVFNEMLQIFHCSPPLFSQQKDLSLIHILLMIKLLEPIEIPKTNNSK